jgi:hypothetical protein
MYAMARRCGALLAASSLLTACALESPRGAAQSPSPTSSPTVAEPSPSPSPSPSPEVEEATIGTWIRGDNGRINVRELELPAEPNREVTLSPGAGNIFAAIQVAACPRDSSVELSESDFVLVDRDFTRYTFWNVQDHAKAPRISDIGTIDVGSCGSGWVTFIVPQGAKVREVLYLGADTFTPGIHDETLTWEVKAP